MLMKRTIILGALSLTVACIQADPEEIDSVSDGIMGGVPKVTICHVPPGNPDNPQTITIGAPAVEAHFANHPDDHYGACDEPSDGGAPPDGGDGGECPCDDKYDRCYD